MINAAVWSLLLQNPTVLGETRELSSVTSSPVANSGLQRTTSVELLSYLMSSSSFTASHFGRGSILRAVLRSREASL